jgi:hypothetical protein
MTKPYPFNCSRCSQLPADQLSYFAATDSWLAVYPKERLVHVHFGVSTATDEESTAESEWVYDQSTKRLETEWPGVPFFGIVDLSRADDSELPSNASLEFYKKMMAHPQNAMTVFYASTPGLKFFINMIKNFSHAYAHMAVVDSAAEAEARYLEWWQKQDVA